MNETGKKILEKIKESHIKPKPKREFLLKNYIIWSIFGIAILFGSFAISVIIFMITHTDWQYFAIFAGPIKRLLINLPYFWLIILVIFLVIALYNLRHTKKGYRYNTLVIVLGSIIISVVVGSVIYAFGGGEKLEDIFYQRMPIYKKIMNHYGRFSLAPEKGLIAGVVVQVNENNIKVRDFRGQIWNIATSTDQFRVGQRVHILGQKISDDEFKAHLIEPWFRPHRHFFQMRSQMRPRRP